MVPPPAATAKMEQISLFCALIGQRRFDDATLGFLQSLLVAKDVKSSSEIRSCLRRFLRSESPLILREIAYQSIDRVLLVLDFLVKATALMSDFESCLALRYEALVLRDAKSASHQWLEVGCGEWLRFAENAIDYGFHPIARKACDNALLCLRKNGISDTQVIPILDEDGVSKRIERLRSIALSSLSSCSVQAEAAEYLKRKNDKESQQSAFSSDEHRQCASALYRESIKKRHAREFSQLRLTSEPHHHKNEGKSLHNDNDFGFFLRRQ